jgi:hypothetical protein
MKKAKFLVVGLGALGLGSLIIQLVPVPRTNPPVESEIKAPTEVQAILKSSCYDCHSNETVWLWYSKVAPVSWLVARDVAEGRRRVNFSTWGRYGQERQAAILAHGLREMRRGRMPPWFYTLKHPEAKITPEKLTKVEAWLAQTK